jgi:uncharacterized phage protein gp47/JayE
VYEHQTFKAILQRMLDQVPNSVDKREGSIIYDALAPAAVELAQMYIELDTNLKLGFAETSSGIYVGMRTSELGVYRNAATKAHRRGLFYNSSGSLVDVPLASRFSISKINYTVIEKEAIGQFILECETTGEVGNQHFGDMIPIVHIDDLTRAELTDVIVPGEEEQTDESLFAEYQEQIDQPKTSNNKAQLKSWALEVEGVGDAKIFPLWNGDNTAKVVIVDSTISPTSPELVANVQEYIDPGITGLGDGQAGIGLFCTVESATNNFIDTSSTLVLASGKTLADAQQEIEKGLDEYYKSIAFKETIVRYAQIGSIILNAESVMDYSNLLVNGGTANVSMLETEIPARGTVTLNE